MTNELRKLVVTQLKTKVSNVYYREADEGAMYPHVVFSFDSDVMNNDDLNRHQYTLIIDVWNRNKPADAETLADAIVDLLNGANLPQSSIVPTFFLERKGWVLDEDKAINHIQLRYTVQIYER